MSPVRTLKQAVEEGQRAERSNIKDFWTNLRAMGRRSFRRVKGLPLIEISTVILTATKDRSLLSRGAPYYSIVSNATTHEEFSEHTWVQKADVAYYSAYQQ